MSFDSNIHEKIIIGGTEKGYRLKSSAPAPIRHITVGSFRLRFTIAEKVAIETSADPVVKVLKDDLAASSYIDFENQALLDGLAYYESVGILAPGRIAELTADGTPEEAVNR
ncbi:hypothetical protein [Neptunicella sp. SCSIO 80796]|uniref:hypothetical protein n=1 Tax=Neptunicella plasticusilytica TaxID=3117012 RepID=UPI003A4E6428